MNSRHVMLLAVFAGIMTALSFFSIPSEGAEKTKNKGTVVVSEGKTVTVNYTMKVGGKVLETSIGHKPVQFKTGSHQVVPGFEKAVMGMKVGEKKSFSVSPAEGFGLEDPKAIKNVPKKQIPPDIKPKAGMLLDTQGKNGQRVPVRVVEVKKDVVVINFNHPLAGKTLNYDIEVLEIK
jgi:FKBP-type peptidyl-prolyl cis-trans isomerase SlyD